MNILQIANYTKGVGGISAQVELLTNNLRDEGYNCKVISTKGSILCRIKSLLSIIKQGRDFSVFHIHACSNRGFFPAVVGITLGRALKKKVLLTYHGGDAESFFSKHPRLIRHYLCKTDHNIVLSGYLGRVFDQFDIPYTVIPNIIEFRPDLFKDRTIIEPHFICIRSLRPLYNIKCILQAYQLVQDKLPGAELTFVGDGVERQSLETFVSDNSLKNVRFVGRVPNSDIPSYLNRADVMLSSPIIDNMPVSLLEGFNSGLLVISSNVGGVPYIVEHGVNGLLFESNNYQQLADLMLFACSHQEDSKEMIQNAYKGMIKYTWKSIRERYLSLCQN